MKCGDCEVMARECHEKERLTDALIAGYKEMSRINLSLAEEAVASDNEALEICEQNIAECE